MPLQLQLSQADLTVYDITHTLLKQHTTVLDTCPNIRKTRTSLEQLPKVKAYLEPGRTRNSKRWLREDFGAALPIGTP
ncbi:hypothetical protein ACOMHN_067572 [Nucella lapillus]